MQSLRILLVCVVQLCFFASAIAGTGTYKFTIGVETGGGGSWLNRGGPEDIQASVYYARIMPAVSAGVYFRYNFNRVFSLGTGLYYDRINFMQAFNYMDFAEEPPDGFHPYHLNYITLPVLARAAFGKKTKFTVNAGGYFSILAKPTTIPFYPNYRFNPYTPPSHISPLNAGITFGIGLSIPLSQHFDITIEERNNVGLVKIIDILHTTSSVLLMGVTYSFGGKGEKK